MPVSTIPGAGITTSTTLTTPIVATTMGVGGATPSNSGSGITFPATQSASTDVNTLDDYEEGTWTPVLVPTTGTITSQTTIGRYVKIGRQVTVFFQAQLLGGTVSVINSISGLPFVAADLNYVGGSAREFFATGNLWFASTSIGGSSLGLNQYNNSQTVSNNFAWAGFVSYVTST